MGILFLYTSYFRAVKMLTFCTLESFLIKSGKLVLRGRRINRKDRSKVKVVLKKVRGKNEE